MSDEILKWIRFAIDLEEKGLEFYKDCQAKSTHPRAIELFEFLIKAEKEHKKVLTDLLDAYSKGDKDKMQKSVAAFMDIHIDVPVFTKEDKTHFKEHDRELREAFNKAREMEEKAKDLYLDLAEKEPDPGLKMLFEKIAADEVVHKREITELGFFVFGSLPTDENLPDKDNPKTPDVVPED